MLKIFLKIFFILLISLNVYGQNGNLKGYIDDGNEPIPSVNILVQNFNIGTSTDEKGYFLLENLTPRKYKLKISSVGYKTKFVDVQIHSNKTTEIKITLDEEVIELEQVEIIGYKTQAQEDTRTSLIDLNPQNAKIQAGAIEDVLRTLQSMPGVLAPNDFSSQLIVRGSGPDENLIIIDDIEVFNPYRLYGTISMFNPDAVSNINLITGGFPAKYGDRLSAVLDVTNKEGRNNTNFGGKISASILDANVIFEGKNPFNIKGSWIINSRRTYYDLIIEPFVKNAGLVDENVTFPNFYDVQSKIVFGPFDGHKFLFNFIFSEDGVDLISAKDRKTPDSVAVYNTTKNNVLNFTWQYSPNENFLNKLIFSRYTNDGLADFQSKVLDPSLNRDEFDDAISDTLGSYLLGADMNTDFLFRKYSIDDKMTFVWERNVLEGGVGVDFLETTLNFNFILDPQLEAIFNANPNSFAKLDNIEDVKRYNKYKFYIQNNFKISDKLNLHPGIRIDYYELLEDYFISPRFSFSYAFDNTTTLRGAWGIYYQSSGYEKLWDQNAFYDFSKENVRDLKPEKSIHYILGFERWISNEWNFRLETYYKDYSDLVIQKSVIGSKYFTEMISGKDPRYSSGWTQPILVSADSLTQIPINASIGESYGIEILVGKKNINKNSKLNGWISYAYAVANRTQNGGTYPFTFDQKHTVNVILNYKISNKWDLGLRWQYGSGFPFAEPLGITPRIILTDTNGDFIPETPTIATRKSFANPYNDEVIFDLVYDDRGKFNSRKPDYHRLDIRISYNTKLWGLDWIFYLDVMNVYNHKNIISYDYYMDKDLTLKREATAMIPILPTFGFNIRF
ncbi:MAG: carboxypeptidase-like regulatory domain-containing protein [Ignavibacterium sp.]